MDREKMEVIDKSSFIIAFPPAKLVLIVLAEFGTSEDSSAATREERKVAAMFVAALREAVAAAVEVETNECFKSDIPRNLTGTM
ncbi:unnamed protein product [Haemonchus placei]|uniref:Uncharacterized protein n=1 Tax=Haemonchus placei TaxID=6290 RepID=A0A0N4WK04_HAEPC|nr:unnamed protein product [Haemonchus placei]